MRFTTRRGLVLFLGAWVLMISMVWAADPVSPAKAPAYVAAPGQFPEDHYYTGLRKVPPETIHRLLPGTAGKAVFLEFKSKFCLACKKMDPILEELLPRHPAVETRILDIMKDKQRHAEVFQAFQPAVVPIQLYLNQRGEVITIFYDYHDRDDLAAALSCIDPTRHGLGCRHLQSTLSRSDGWMSRLEAAIQGTIATGSLVTILLAFCAGLISSFFPCSVAMLPVLVGYVGGYSQGNKRDVLFQVLVFILGLATVMTGLGIILSLLGQTFGSQSNGVFYGAVGLLCLLMGLQTMGVIHLPLPQTIKALPETRQGQLATFYILGCAFGLVASPCGTPVLAAILGVVSQEGNLLLGGASLFAYAVGQGLLLLMAGLFTGLLKHREAFMLVGNKLSKISGVIILGVGLSFILQALGLWTPLLETLHLRQFIQ